MPAISESMVWTGFLVFLALVLFLDLFVFHRKTREVTFREASFWIVVWATFAMGFAGILYVLPGFGREAASQFVTGYVLEQALSVDNLFVFILIFKGFAVRLEYQHRVLFWGVLGAIFLRGSFILLGEAIVSRFEWVLYLFGLFLLYTGGRLLVGGDDDDDEMDVNENRVVKITKRLLGKRMTDHYRADRFFVVENGMWMATPLLLVAVVVEVSDLIFAVDSIPTIFAITTRGVIVFTSNMFAILGLRNVFIILNRLLPRFRFLEKAVSIILVFIGVKLLVRYFGVHIDDGISLAVVGALLVGSVVLSSIIPEKKEDEPADEKKEAEPADETNEAESAPTETPAVEKKDDDGNDGLSG
jgi:tellurite resistance protein TerC